MSNLPALPDHAPDYSALLAQCPELATVNQDAAAGIGASMPPTIVAAKGRFTIKEGGEETIASFPATMPNGDPHPAAGQPISVLSTVVLKGKPGVEKTWYATKFVPGQEPVSPDCFSLDGIKPDPSSKMKQCESCAGCPQNVFGSGTTQDGGASKGKACSDKKVLAIYANNGVYRFAIPPASLNTFASYTKQLDGRGIHLPTVITAIGFDAVDDYKLTFTFGGMLAPEAISGKILPMLKSNEVIDIVGGNRTAIAYTPTEEKAQIADNSAAEAAKAAAEKEKADKAAKAAAAKAAKEAKAKEEAEKAAAAAASAGDGSLGLDLGLGMDMGSAPAETVATTATNDVSPADADIIAGLNL